LPLPAGSPPKGKTKRPPPLFPVPSHSSLGPASPTRFSFFLLPSQAFSTRDLYPLSFLLFDSGLEGNPLVFFFSPGCSAVLFSPPQLFLLHAPERVASTTRYPPSFWESGNAPLVSFFSKILFSSMANPPNLGLFHSVSFHGHLCSCPVFESAFSGKTPANFPPFSPQKFHRPLFFGLLRIFPAGPTLVPPDSDSTLTISPFAVCFFL